MHHINLIQPSKTNKDSILDELSVSKAAWLSQHSMLVSFSSVNNFFYAVRPVCPKFNLLPGFS